MADNDYICVYRQFFEEFAKTFQTEECRPVRVNLYNLSIDELHGEVMQSCVNFLTERKCPRSLIVPLTKIVVEEFLHEAKKQPDEVDTPLKLNRKTHDKISEVCLRYTDNEKLSSLPGPVKEIEFSTHSTKHTRRRMEDRLICLPRFNALHNVQSSSEAGFYGIFDGHGGVNAACYAVSHLHQFLAESEFYPEDPVGAFRTAFEKTESRYNLKDENSGTAVLAILHQVSEKRLVVSWVGDSQAMLVDADSYVMLVDPHKPERKDEAKRIEDLGGFILKAQSVYRVNGGLAISRAIGDSKLKPYVSAEPEIRVVDLTGAEHFIVMGCDGLWDVVEPREVIETVYFEVKQNEGQVDTVARRLVDLAKENNSTDNISVIVIFLRDPAEISNRSVDATGHRPKTLIQDGVIMEANFQASEKSPLSDSGANGLFDANGVRFEDRARNEFDDDFGPETDVDAVDDPLAPSPNPNPFADHCWQKSQPLEQNADRLIEFARPEPAADGGEFIKFSQPAEHSFEKLTNEPNSDDFKSDKFSSGYANPFEASVINNKSDFFEFSDLGGDENNKYREEVNSKEEVNSFVNLNLSNLSSDVKIAHSAETNEDGAADSVSEPKGNSFDASPMSPMSGDQATAEEAAPATAGESPKEEMPGPLGDEVSSPDHESNLPGETTATPTPNEMEPPACESELEGPAVAESEVRLAEEQPGLVCAGNGDAEPEELSKKEKDTEDGKSSQSLAFDGEAKDEIVAESGGEVDDSEDEWNYIKVESALDGDLVSIPGDSSQTDKSPTNWSLNPNAAEFIPVAPISTDGELTDSTPKKSIPRDLTDIVASSPNWTNMENIRVPEESAFLAEIKSRPSNIFETEDAAQKIEENVVEMVRVEEAEDQKMDVKSSPEEPGKPEESLGAVSAEEIRGIALAGDMTSSFIDPSTAGADVESPSSPFDFAFSPTKEPVAVKTDVFSNECFERPIQEPVDSQSENLVGSPELASPNVESAADVALSAETPDPAPATEPAAPSAADLFPSAVDQSKGIESSTLPPATDAPCSKPADVEAPPSREEAIPETPEKSSAEATSNKTVAPEVAATSAAVAAAAIAATVASKKDVKKAAPPNRMSQKSSTTAKPGINGVKTTAAKTSAPTLPSKSPTVPKTTTKVASSFSTSTKTSAVGSSAANKTAPKPSSLSAASPTKVQARTKPAAAPSAISKTPAASKTTAAATTASTKTLPAAKVPAAAAPKPKPRVPSASAEKKPTPKLNGDAKPAAKRPEPATKKPSAATATPPRVSAPARPATAPARPAAARTPSATTAASPAPKARPLPRKPAVGSDKQAKELANRITSRTSASAKANGAPPARTTATAVKSARKSSATTAPATATKGDNKTETKAEKIVDESVESIQSKNGDPFIDSNKDRSSNLINPFASD